MRKILTVFALACLLLCSLFVARGDARSHPVLFSHQHLSQFFGMTAQSQPSSSDIALMKASGISSLRVPIIWQTIQPRPHVHDWSGLDSTIAANAAGGLGTFPFIVSTPSWMTKDWRVMPVDRAWQRKDWDRFLKALVRRYGPNGSFWIKNPQLPYHPIRAWQIWNEPNASNFTVIPSPTQFGKLLITSATAIRSVDAHAKIVIGGLYSTPMKKPPIAYPATVFLQMLYQRWPQLNRYYDVMALHPYTSSARELPHLISGIRDVMSRHHAQAKQLWITEMGWGSSISPERTVFEKGPVGQAHQLKYAYTDILVHRLQWRIQRVYWFSWDDIEGSCSFCDSSGLFGSGDVAKPAWKVFTSFSKFAG